MNIYIRNAVKEDAEFIAVIEKKYIKEAWSLKLISDEIEKVNAIFLVAICDDKICGYVSGENIAGEFYINNIAVDEKFRRMHIGKKLMEHIGLVAEELGCVFITLEVRNENIAAKYLYEKCGYIPVGTRKNYYSKPTDDAVIYTKNFIK